MVKLSALLIALIFFSRPVLPLLEYVINYDYIVKELCINKDKINTACNGKCHLKKELAEASHSDLPGTKGHKPKPVEFETLFFSPIDEFLLALPSVHSPAPADTYSKLYGFSPSLNFLHPPAQV